MDIISVLFVSGLCGGREVVGSLTQKAALYTALPRFQVPKRPMEVTGCGPGHVKVGDCT